VSTQDKKDNCYICDRCYLGIERQTPPFCQKCGRGLAQLKSIQKGICATCSNRQYYFQRALSVARYEGVIKNLIHKFKYNHKLQYTAIFRVLFKEFLDAFKVLDDIDLIIPIPLHPTRLREREYNQAQVLASLVSEIINKPVESNILIRLRNTKPQIDLDEKTRIKNISGCFAIKHSGCIRSKSLLLIDDVFTTGTTLSEAAKAITEFKPNNISVLTLAS